MKVYPDAFAWKLGKELFVYERLSAIPDLSTPAVIGPDDTHSVTDANFLVLSKLHGEYMRFQFDKKLAEFRALGGSNATATAIERFVDERASAFDICDTPSLCHDDVYENNILVEHSTDGLVLTGLLDVENAVAGDPLIDLSKTWLYSIRSAGHERLGLADGYVDLGDRASERLDLYRLYHSLELWDWFAQTGNRLGVDSVTPDLLTFSTVTGDW